MLCNPTKLKMTVDKLFVIYYNLIMVFYYIVY